jgi:hypothetical protein
MSGRVIKKDHAKKDLLEEAWYIALDNPQAAERVPGRGRGRSGGGDRRQPVHGCEARRRRQVAVAEGGADGIELLGIGYRETRPP